MLRETLTVATAVVAASLLTVFVIQYAPRFKPADFMPASTCLEILSR